MAAPSMLDQLPLAALQHHSAIELQKFQRQEVADPQYAYELFRRALTASERSTQDAAWSILEHQYTPLLKRWVSKHRLFRLTGEVDEYFTTMALTKFWLYFTTGPGDFTRFSDLPQLLRFLQVCVNHVIIDAYRAQLRYVQADIGDEVASTSSPIVLPMISNTVETEELWQMIYKEAQTELEKLWIYAYFELLLPRRKIVELFPQFENVETVKQVMDTFLKRMRRNARLTQFLALYQSE